MKKALFILFALFYCGVLSAQGFDINREGSQTFYFYDEKGRNQATFESEAPLEDITGTANGVDGVVTFDVNDIKTLEGTLYLTVKSMRTGIDMRDSHLISPNWLDADKHPRIIYKIKEVENAEKTGPNKIKANVIGEFTMKGVTKDVPADVVITYLEESETTKQRAEGDLLGVNADFTVNLSGYGVNNEVVGNKVAEEIKVSFKAVGSNKEPANRPAQQTEM